MLLDVYKTGKAYTQIMGISFIRDQLWQALQQAFVINLKKKKRLKDFCSNSMMCTVKRHSLWYNQISILLWKLKI